MRLVQFNTEEEQLGIRLKLWFTINFLVKYHSLLNAIRRDNGQNGHNVSIKFRETRIEDNRRVKSTTVEVAGAEADVRRMMAEIRSAAPWVEELTKTENENYYEWLTCPHDMHGKMRRLEKTTRTCITKDRNVEKAVIIGYENNIRQLMRILAEKAGKWRTLYGPQAVIRGIIGHHWARAKPIEMSTKTRFIKKAVDGKPFLTELRIVGDDVGINGAMKAINDPKNMLVYNKVYACEALGVFFTRHGQNHQQSIENDTNTVIIFDKAHPHENLMEDVPEDQRVAYKEVSMKAPDAPTGRLSLFAVVGLSKDVDRALAKIHEINNEIYAVRMVVSFYSGRYIMGPNGKRRKSIEKAHDVTIHLEREDESQDRNINSSVLIVGFPDNVTAAITDLHAGHYDLKTNPLVEMVYEIRGEHRQILVPGNDDYEKVNKIQSSTGTQINVSHQLRRECECGKEVNWVCDVSVCGPTDRVHEAFEELGKLFPNFGFEPSIRPYRGYVADVDDATQPVVDDQDRGRYVYPRLFYSVERREPLSKDAFGGECGSDYVKKCRLDGVLYCRECAKLIVMEQVGRDGDFEIPPESDPSSTPTEFGQPQDKQVPDWDARPADPSGPSEPKPASYSKCDSQTVSYTQAAYGGGSRTSPSHAHGARQYKKPTASHARATASNANATASNVHANAPHMNATTSCASATAPNAIGDATYAQTAAPNAKAPISYAQAAGSNKKPTVTYAQGAERMPNGSRINPQDISDRDLKRCQIGGMRMCGPKCGSSARDADVRSGGSRAAPSRVQAAKQYKKPIASRTRATASNANATVSNVHANASHANATAICAPATAPNAICGAAYASATAPNTKAPMSYAQAAGSSKKPTVSYVQVAASSNKPATGAASTGAPLK